MILGGQLPGKVGSRWGKYSSLAQSVEHSAVNRVVVGSSPTGGAKVWPLGQVVKTPPFHGDNMGSNPVGVTTLYLIRISKGWSIYKTADSRFLYGPLAQLVRATGS